MGVGIQEKIFWYSSPLYFFSFSLFFFSFSFCLKLPLFFFYGGLSVGVYMVIVKKKTERHLTEDTVREAVFK